MMTVIAKTHYRPKLRIEQAEPGEGYRLLEAYEVIQPTDEVWARKLGGVRGWVRENSKAGRPLLDHWRPRRRLLPAATYPRYWVNVQSDNTVYCATSENCTGHMFIRKWRNWSRCADDSRLIDHVQEYPDTYKPITFEEAVKLGIIPLFASEERVEEDLKQAQALAQQAKEFRLGTKGLYNELINAVATKHPGETRHQTALRYIQERESRVTSSVETLLAAVGTLKSSY